MFTFQSKAASDIKFKTLEVHQKTFFDYLLYQSIRCSCVCQCVCVCVCVDVQVCYLFQIGFVYRRPGPSAIRVHAAVGAHLLHYLATGQETLIRPRPPGPPRG